MKIDKFYLLSPVVGLVTSKTMHLRATASGKENTTYCLKTITNIFCTLFILKLPLIYSRADLSTSSLLPLTNTPRVHVLRSIHQTTFTLCLPPSPTSIQLLSARPFYPRLIRHF